jgi:hypothetical protein
MLAQPADHSGKRGFLITSLQKRAQKLLLNPTPCAATVFLPPTSPNEYDSPKKMGRPPRTP